MRVLVACMLFATAWTESMHAKQLRSMQPAHTNG